MKKKIAFPKESAAAKVDRPSPSEGGAAHGQERGRGGAQQGERKTKERKRGADAAIRTRHSEHERMNLARHLEAGIGTGTA